MAGTTVAVGTLRTDTPTLVIFLIGFVAIFAVLTRSGDRRHPVHSVTVADPWSEHPIHGALPHRSSQHLYTRERFRHIFLTAHSPR
jgi:hypothetical protein